jgi:NACHT domain
MRRSALKLLPAAIVLVLLSLVGNLATGIVEVPLWAKPWVWVSAAVLAISAIVIDVRRNQQNSLAPTPNPNRAALNDATDLLAAMVERDLRLEEEHQRVHDPYPIPVCWRTTDDSLLDDWANIRRAPAGTSLGPLALGGRLDQIVSVYRRVPSGRLVVLGEPGSGKTVLATQFVRDSLTSRTNNEHVPVIFRLSLWNPTISLRDWLVGQLVENYKALAKPGSIGHSIADDLVDSQRILPVLDGFDEIAPRLHRTALRALNATSIPLLLTSRPDEYVEATKCVDVLSGAAGITLNPLTFSDLGNYLPRTTRKTVVVHGGTTCWDSVLKQLRDGSTGVAAKNLLTCLSTPLMVSLARSIYSDTPNQNPDELLDIRRFPSVQEIENHLLSAYVPAVYQHWSDDRRCGRRQWDTEDVEHWLGMLAKHLQRTCSTNLAWWQLRNSIPRSGRMLLFGVIGAAGCAVLLNFIWVIGAGLGAGLGISIGAATEGPPPARTRLRFRGRLPQVLRNVLFGMMGGIAGGVAGGLSGHLLGGIGLGFLAALDGPTLHPLILFGIGFSLGLILGGADVVKWAIKRQQVGFEKRVPASWPMHIFQDTIASLITGLLGGIVLGPAGGIALGLSNGFSTGLIDGLEAPVDTTESTSPRSLLRTERSNTTLKMILFGLTVGLPVGLAGGLALGWTNGLTLGLASGLTYGLGVGLGMTAWGQWLIVAHLWLPVTGRLPWRVETFLYDAHCRKILRQAGAYFQFRHKRLQERYAWLVTAGCEAQGKPKDARSDRVP